MLNDKFPLHFKKIITKPQLVKHNHQNFHKPLMISLK